LEDDTGTTNGVNDGGETWLGQNDVGGTTGSVGSTLDGDPDVGAGTLLAFEGDSSRSNDER
jgi:hypothetical protein